MSLELLDERSHVTIAPDASAFPALFFVGLVMLVGCSKQPGDGGNAGESGAPRGPKVAVRPAEKSAGDDLQKRIDAADAGTTITLAAGRYAGPFHIRKPVGLQAAEGAKVELVSSATDGAVLRAEGVSGINLAGISFDAAPSKGKRDEAPAPAVHLRNSSGVIRDCAFRNSCTAGLRIEGKSEFDVSRSLFERNNEEGLLVKSADARVTADGCRSEENGWGGFVFNEGSKGLIADCRGNHNGWDGTVIAEEGADVVIRRSEFIGNGYRGIKLTLAAKARIEDCVAAENGTVGIEIAMQGTEAVVQRNVSRDNATTGIRVIMGAAALVSGNRCNGNEAGCGILIQHFGTSAGVLNNECSGNGKDGIQFGCEAEGEVSGNTLTDNGESGIAIHHKGTKVVLGENAISGNALEEVETTPETEVPFEVDPGEVRWLLTTGRFDRLRGIVTRATEPPIQQEGGAWTTEKLYAGLGPDGKDRAAIEKHISHLRELARAWPQSDIPGVALVGAYTDLAWAWRGGGWASEVTEEGWEKFRYYIDAAEQNAIDLDKRDCRDPELYATWITLGMAMNYSPEDMTSLLESGLAADARCHAIYSNYAYYLLPRWGGTPAKVERFARDSVKHAGGFEDEGMYARIALWTIRMEGAETLRDDYAFDYEILRKGCERLIGLYGETAYLLNVYANLASTYEDKETSRALFERIGEDFDSYAWRTRQDFNRARAWARSDKASWRTGK